MIECVKCHSLNRVIVNLVKILLHEEILANFISPEPRQMIMILYEGYRNCCVAPGYVLFTNGIPSLCDLLCVLFVKHIKWGSRWAHRNIISEIIQRSSIHILFNVVTYISLVIILHKAEMGLFHIKLSIIQTVVSYITHRPNTLNIYLKIASS
jgi:hypothetical protein